MSAILHKDERVIERGAELLAHMKDLCSSLIYAVLLTDDGFEVVRLARTATDGGRFASMASSMQALSEAVARELHIGSAQYTIIASESGHVVQLRVPEHPLVISALFDNDETLGKALAISRQTAEKMASMLAPAA
jgi:predicted regulator of Ras-like GTPase activity (Roadblock/LC7/MglB family)